MLIEAGLVEGGDRDESAARLVEMPAARTYDSFSKWNRKQTRKGSTAFRDAAGPNRHTGGLQPFHRYSDPAAHLLARLVVYTNHSQHRTPAITAVQIPVVNREDAPPKAPA